MPRGDRSGATRDALLGAATRVFIRRGPYGATVREIAEEAGVTVPAIYYHFEGTEQLYDTVVRESRARFRAMAEGALVETSEPYARLTGFARACLRFGEEDPTRLRLLCMDLFGPQEATPVREPASDRGAAELRDWVRERLTLLLADLARTDGEGAPLASRLLVAMMSGLLVEQAREPETSILDVDLADRAIEVFLHGIEGGTGCARSRSGGRA